jgi:hypothetical protein
MSQTTTITGEALNKALTGQKRAHAIRWALKHRGDLVASEANVVAVHAITHQQRWAELSQTSYGTSGGSAHDRRLAAEGLALLEHVGLLKANTPLSFAAR